MTHEHRRSNLKPTSEASPQTGGLENVEPETGNQEFGTGQRRAASTSMNRAWRLQPQASISLDVTKPEPQMNTDGRRL